MRAGYACELNTRGLGGHTEAASCGAEEAYLIVRTCPWSHVGWDAAGPATGVRVTWGLLCERRTVPLGCCWFWSVIIAVVCICEIDSILLFGVYGSWCVLHLISLYRRLLSAP